MPRNGITRRSVLKRGVGAGAVLAGGLTVGVGTAAADTASKIDNAIYVDDHVYEDSGYQCAWTAQQLLGRALEYNDIYDYAVTVVRDHSFDVRDLSSTKSCDDILPAFDDWLKNNNLKADHENHHLIHHSDEALGGCAWPRVSVGWGDSLHELNTYDPARYAKKTRGVADDAVGDAVQVTLHEISHTLGIGHGDGMHYTDEDSVHGNPSLPGDGDDVYTTPQGAPMGGDNDCGQPADDVSNYDVEYADAYYWYDCAGSLLRDNFDRTHVLTIEGTGSEANYEFTVSGTLSKSTKCDATKNSYDSISGSTADGRVIGGRDSYEFTGRITDFTHSGADINTYIDCNEVFVASLGHNAVTVDGGSDGDSEYYSITVTGGLRKSDANSATINEYDAVETNTADGRVMSGRDTYRYWGGVLVSGFDDEGATVSYVDV
ncbi:MAG: hypothetical protein ABEJ08_01810 [Halobacteriaceae archaeon]